MLARLKRLTEDILDVSRIENRSLQLNKQEFNLFELITRSCIIRTIRKISKKLIYLDRNQQIKMQILQLIFDNL